VRDMARGEIRAGFWVGTKVSGDRNWKNRSDYNSKPRTVLGHEHQAQVQRWDQSGQG